MPSPAYYERRWKALKIVLAIASVGLFLYGVAACTGREFGEMFRGLGQH